MKKVSTVSILNSFVPLLQVGTLSQEGSWEYALEIATGVFSFVLFAVTLYAWWRRGRQPTLIIVSIAFLAFFAKQLVEVLPLSQFHGELFSSTMDFVTLALFFMALVVRPRRKPEKENSNPAASQENDSTA